MKAITKFFNDDKKKKKNHDYPTAILKVLSVKC